MWANIYKCCVRHPEWVSFFVFIGNAVKILLTPSFNIVNAFGEMVELAGLGTLFKADGCIV